MVWTSAVVLPPLNRLSRSFSSFTSTIERMRCAEQIGVVLHLAAVLGPLVEQDGTPSRIGLGLALAASADQVEQALDLGVVGDDLAVRGRHRRGNMGAAGSAG